jgi:hypothetical protein
MDKSSSFLEFAAGAGTAVLQENHLSFLLLLRTVRIPPD